MHGSKLTPGSASFNRIADQLRSSEDFGETAVTVKIHVALIEVIDRLVVQCSETKGNVDGMNPSDVCVRAHMRAFVSVKLSGCACDVMNR